MEKELIKLEDYEIIIAIAKTRIKYLEKEPTAENIELIKKYKAQILEAKTEMVEVPQLNKDFAERKKLHNIVDKTTQKKLDRFDKWIEKRDKLPPEKKAEVHFCQKMVIYLQKSNGDIKKINGYKNIIMSIMED